MSSDIKLSLFLLVVGTAILQITGQQLTGEFDFGNAINKSNTYLEKAAKDSMIPGIVAGVNINGTQVWAHAVGHTDIENDVVTRVDSVWRLGSISKSLTSALIAKLIDEGRLDLNKPINHYLKTTVFPNKMWNKKIVNITLGQVMSHTAGLRVMKFPDDLYKRIELKNVTDTISLFKDEPLLFEPGTHWNYSNYGFQVVGAVIESVLNQTYENAINKMFKELEMNTTFCERREQIIPHRARYYIKTTDANNKTKMINAMLADELVSIERWWPAGGIVSTIPDLLKFGSHMSKWSKGFTTTKLFNLSKTTINKLWAPVSDMPSTFEYKLFKSKYAHGWMMGTFDVPKVCPRCKFSPIKEFMYHTGGISGVSTILIVEPQNDIVFSFFINRNADLKFLDIFENIFKYFIE